MRETDPFAHDDAAYVLGALDEPDRRAFEQHLAGCADCAARVRELQHLPAALGMLTEQELMAVGDAPPDGLLTGLLHRAAAQRRRRRWIGTGIAAAVAAAAAAVVIGVWPASAPAPERPPAQAMTALVSSPVHAQASLAARAWGTEIRLDCHYDAGAAGTGYVYGLAVVDDRGATHELGSWTLAAGDETTFTSGTALRLNDIRSVQISYAGRTILQLRP